jgi:hypothetical protein
VTAGRAVVRLGAVLFAWAATCTVWAALPGLGAAGHQPLGWALPVAVVAAAVAAGWRLGRAAGGAVLPAPATAPGQRPTSRPVPARLCDPAAPGRPRPRAPGRRGRPRAA